MENLYNTILNNTHIDRIKPFTFQGIKYYLLNKKGYKEMYRLTSNNYDSWNKDNDELIVYYMENFKELYIDKEYTENLYGKLILISLMENLLEIKITQQEINLMKKEGYVLDYI